MHPYNINPNEMLRMFEKMYTAEVCVHLGLLKEILISIRLTWLNKDIITQQRGGEPNREENQGRWRPLVEEKQHSIFSSMSFSDWCRAVWIYFFFDFGVASTEVLI